MLPTGGRLDARLAEPQPPANEASRRSKAGPAIVNASVVAWGKPAPKSDASCKSGGGHNEAEREQALRKRAMHDGESASGGPIATGAVLTEQPWSLRPRARSVAQPWSSVPGGGRPRVKICGHKFGLGSGAHRSSRSRRDSLAGFPYLLKGRGYFEGGNPANKSPTDAPKLGSSSSSPAKRSSAKSTVAGPVPANRTIRVWGAKQLTSADFSSERHLRTGATRIELGQRVDVAFFMVVEITHEQTPSAARPKWSGEERRG